MDSREARVRLARSTGDLEVEGSEDFVREILGRFEAWVEQESKSSRPPKPPGSDGVGHTPSPSGQAQGGVAPPAEFGEYYHRFPRTIADTEKILLAGYFVQSHSEDNVFKTAEANKALQNQGVKVSNPSQCVTYNREGKRVFTVSNGKYRVSEAGVNHLSQLLATEPA